MTPDEHQAHWTKKPRPSGHSFTDKHEAVIRVAQTANSSAEYTLRTRCPQCELLRAAGALLPLREALRLPAIALVYKLGASS